MEGPGRVSVQARGDARGPGVRARLLRRGAALPPAQGTAQGEQLRHRGVFPADGGGRAAVAGDGRDQGGAHRRHEAGGRVREERRGPREEVQAQRAEQGWVREERQRQAAAATRGRSRGARRLRRRRW